MNIKTNCLGLLAGLSMLAFTGCSKIYFHNGDSMSTANLPPPSFHHIGVIGLVEFSPAVDLKAICEGKDWETVQTVNTFLTGLVGGLTNQLYTPQGVAVSCKDK